jgi:hypothetical protein
MNQNKLSIKKYIATLVISSTIGMLAAALILTLIGNQIGFGSQGVLIMILIAFPFVQFSSLFGFYKGLKKYYDLKT